MICRLEEVQQGPREVALAEVRPVAAAESVEVQGRVVELGGSVVVAAGQGHLVAVEAQPAAAAQEAAMVEVSAACHPAPATRQGVWQ